MTTNGSDDARGDFPARATRSDPPGVPPPLKRYYSNAVRVRAGGDLLFVSGQVAWDDQGAVVGVGDPVAQARQALANVGRILRANDGDFSNVVKVTVYVTDLSWFEELSAVREEFFAANPPASAIVQVTSLVQPELLVEVEAVAVL